MNKKHQTKRRKIKRKTQRGNGMVRKSIDWVKNKMKTRKKNRNNRLLNMSYNLSDDFDSVNSSGFYDEGGDNMSLNKLRRIYKNLYKKNVPRFWRNDKKWILNKIKAKQKKKIVNKSDKNMYHNKIQLISQAIIVLQQLYMQIHVIYNILLNYYEIEQGKESGSFDVRLFPGGRDGQFIQQCHGVISNIQIDQNSMSYCPGINLNLNTGNHPYTGILEFLRGDLNEHILLKDISNLIVNIGCQLNKRYVYNGPGIILNSGEINTIGTIVHINQCQGSCISPGESQFRQNNGQAFDLSNAIWTPHENSSNTKHFIDSSLYTCMVLRNSIMKICKYYRIEELWILADITEYGTTSNKIVSPIPPDIRNLYISLLGRDKANEKMNHVNRTLSESIYINNFNTKNPFLKSLLSEWINEIADAEFKDKIIDIPKYYQLLKLDNIEDMRCGYCKHNSIGVVINKNVPSEMNDDDKLNSQLNRNPVPDGVGIGNATMHYYCTNEKCGAFLGCSSGSIDGVLKQAGTAAASSMGVLLKKIMDKAPEAKGKIEKIASDIAEKIKTTASDASSAVVALPPGMPARSS